MAEVVEQFKGYLSSAKSLVRGWMDNYPSIFFTEHFKNFERQLGVAREYLLFAVLFVLSFMLFTLGGAALVINLVAFVYPAYCSIKALDKEDPDTHTHWLIYWVIYAFYQCFDLLIDILFSWIPLYFLVKIFFIVYAYHPATKGGDKLYALLRPLVRKHILKIDDDVPTPPATIEKGTFFFLKADIKAIHLAEESNVRVELTVKPPADRAKAGVEGTKYKTPNSYGQIIEPNYNLTAAPLKHADGIVVIELVHSMEFGDDEVLATKEIPLNNLQYGVTTSEKIVFEELDAHIEVNLLFDAQQ